MLEITGGDREENRKYIRVNEQIHTAATHQAIAYTEATTQENIITMDSGEKKKERKPDQNYQ